MKALDYRKEIRENEAELGTLLSKARAPVLRRRLRFLLLLKTTASLSRAGAGLKLGLRPKGSEEVWKLYKTGGMEKLLDYPFKGRKSSLSDADKAWLGAELKTNGGATLQQCAQRIQGHTGSQKPLSPQAVHYIFKALKIKKKTGRPSHIQKDEGKVEAFKKKSSRS
jgi:transposase